MLGLIRAITHPGPPIENRTGYGPDPDGAVQWVPGNLWAWPLRSVMLAIAAAILVWQIGVLVGPFGGVLSPLLLPFPAILAASAAGFPTLIPCARRIGLSPVAMFIDLGFWRGWVPWRLITLTKNGMRLQGALRGALPLQLNRTQAGAIQEFLTVQASAGSP